MADQRSIQHWIYVLRRGFQVLMGRRARILTYHSVSTERTDVWSISPGQFERHIRLLRDSHLNVVSLAELVRRKHQRLGLERLAAITFDDGYVDFLEYAAPILRDYGMPATVFIPVTLLGKTSRWSRFVPDAPLMTARQVEQALRQGFDIGSHTLTHPRLPALSDLALQEEVAGSHRWLQEQLGISRPAFAYPFGEFGPRESRSVQKAGYDCGVGFGGLWGNGLETGLFELNRDAITRSCHDRAFHLLLNGWNDWIEAARLVWKPWNSIPVR